MTLAGIALISAGAMAQDHKCGTTEAMDEAIKNNPAIQKQLDEFELKYKKIMEDKAANKAAATNYGRQIVPIVIHVIHDYGTENVSEAQCLDAVRVLNEDFQRIAADSNQIASAFFPIRGNANLEFRLAKLDPNGNCTNGITRTYTPLTNNAGDNVKALISWDTKKYLNIWVANTVVSGSSGDIVGGYAYYACSAPAPNYEGVIVSYRQFGSIGTSGGVFSARTLSHEVGHSLNLAHTWGNSNDPGLASNCNIDDGVADTPNTIGSSGCNLSQVTCGTLDNVNNIMDYASCPRMFTEGQVDRVRAAIDTTSNCQYRKYLSTYANLVATGVVDGFVSNCAPVADFNVVNRQICQGNTITYANMSYQAAPDSVRWVFEGGSPSTSSDSLVTVNYNIPGTFTVKLYAYNQYGVDSLVRSQIIRVLSSPGSIQVPYLEGMESSTWPVNSATDSTVNWSEETTTSNNWERTTTAYVSGTASARIKLSAIQNGRINSFVSSPIDMSNISSSTHRLYFKLAYAQRSLSGQGSSDLLRVQFSTDCGLTWITKYSKLGTALNTIGGGTAATTFVPTASDWRTETVTMASIAGKSSVMVKFQCTSNVGTYIYIDDININSIASGIEDSELQHTLQFGIYPNPSDGDAQISYYLDEQTPVKIEVRDITGKQVGNTLDELQAEGNHELMFSELVHNAANGLYVLHISTDKGILVRKFVKN